MMQLCCGFAGTSPQVEYISQILSDRHQVFTFISVVDGLTSLLFQQFLNLKLMSKYQEMQQSHWVCYEFPDKSYYYGEVGYLDESGVVHSKDNTDAANNPKNKLVKHGFGIHIYSRGEAQPSKYEGYWDKDRKQGQGKLTVPGQFTYEGGFKEGCYHQMGRIEWSNGDVYEGNWKKNRMQGGGIFKHHDGFVLKGSFKANFFIDEANVLRNPQMSEKQYTLFKKQRKEVAKQKQRNEKIKSGFILKIKKDQTAKIVETIVKSNKNNRVPLVIASEESKFNLSSLEKVLSDKKCRTFDLRKAYLLKGQQKYNYKQQFSEKTRQTLAEGGALVINLDESQSEYKHAFYPDLKEFYQSNGFNTNTWSRQTMKRKEVYQRLGCSSISDEYVLAVWSKVKLPEQMGEEGVRQKLQLRFESILPFIKMDVIFVIE